MSSRMLYPVAHRRTIAAGVIRGPSIGADGIDHDVDLVDQILAPGRGIACARCHLREHARGGQGGSSPPPAAKAPRIDVRTTSGKR